MSFFLARNQPRKKKTLPYPSPMGKKTSVPRGKHEISTPLRFSARTCLLRGVSFPSEGVWRKQSNDCICRQVPRVCARGKKFRGSNSSKEQGFFPITLDYDKRKWFGTSEQPGFQEIRYQRKGLEFSDLGE